MRSKILLLLFIITCFGKTFSQNRFYLRPCLNTFGGFSYITSLFHKQLTPTYFNFKLKHIVWLPKANVGLVAGYQFNNGKTYIETGILQSGSASGSELLFNEYNPVDSSYNKTNIVLKGFTQGFRVPLLLSTQLAYWDSIKLNKSFVFSLHCNWVFGINFYHQKYRSLLGILTSNEVIYQISPTQIMDVRMHTDGYSARRRLLFQIGLSFELRKNNKEWVTLALCWVPRTPKYILCRQEFYTTVSDSLSGIKKSYWNHSSNAGQGILITLSKKIFVF